MIILLDTETTGREPPEVIELAWIELIQGDWGKGNYHFHQMFKPEKGSCFGALATHHIHDDELQSCAPSSQVTLPPEVKYIIGHNVDYDWEALGKPPVRRICTLAMARTIYPEVDSHKLSAMAYVVSTNYSQTREWIKNAHSAAVDVDLCHWVLSIMLAELALKGITFKTGEELWQFSEKCRVPTIMGFGKYKGKLIKDLPQDYKNWCYRQPDFDPYVIKAMKEQK